MPGSPPARVVRDDRPQRRIMAPQPGLSGGGDRQPGMVPQVRRAPVSKPQPAAQPRPRMESPRPAPPERRIEPRERESRRDTTP